MKEIILEIQGYLRNISRFDEDIPSLIPDGIFKDETARSVKAFQKKHGLEETGRVDFKTWKKLTEENERAVFYFSDPLQTAPATNEDFPLKIGKESSLNKNLNLMLSHISLLYENFQPPEPGDSFTEKTKEQLTIFQSVADINETGEADKETWNLLSRLYLISFTDE